MSKPSDAPAMSVLAAVSFWLGSQPVFMGFLAYHKFWLGEGQGYEGGLSGFVGGMFLWNLFFCIPPAVVWFGVVLLRLMLSRTKASVNFALLFVFSGILGLAWSLFVMVCMGIYGGM
jgi:hypothetical protein